MLRTTVSLGLCLGLIWGCGHGGAASSIHRAPSHPSANTSKRGQAASSLWQQPALRLSQFPLEVEPAVLKALATSASNETFARALSVRLGLHIADPPVGALARHPKLQVRPGQIGLVDASAELLTATDPPLPKHLASTFIVDHREPAVAAVAAQVGPQASAPDFTAFVAEYVQASRKRIFDVASWVATHRTGDCSEYGILLTALLRHRGIPARAVFGIVLIGTKPPDRDPSLIAAAHLWVEYYKGTRWHIADAALHHAFQEVSDRTLVRLVYLPLRVLEDEGPSYAKNLLDGLSVSLVRQVDVGIAAGID